MFLLSSCSCLCPIYWSHVLSWEWRCSWSSADRRCSNYIWVINNLIAYKGAAYIRDFMVLHSVQGMEHSRQIRSLPRADSRFAPSQWEMPLHSNGVSHWLGANLESALKPCLSVPKAYVARSSSGMIHVSRGGGYSVRKMMGVCRWLLKIGPKKMEGKMKFGA